MSSRLPFTSSFAAATRYGTRPSTFGANSTNASVRSSFGSIACLVLEGAPCRMASRAVLSFSLLDHRFWPVLYLPAAITIVNSL